MRSAYSAAWVRLSSPSFPRIVLLFAVFEGVARIVDASGRPRVRRRAFDLLAQGLAATGDSAGAG
jgi:hypothetical protein